jgi:hypothetical protein
MFLFRKAFLHRLNLKLEVGQIGFQFSRLFGFCQVTALEATIPTTALTIASTPIFTFTVFAVTSLVRHFSPSLQPGVQKKISGTAMLCRP